MVKHFITVVPIHLKTYTVGVKNNVNTVYCNFKEITSTIFTWTIAVLFITSAPKINAVTILFLPLLTPHK